MEKHKVFVGCCLVVLNPKGDKVLVAKRLKEPDINRLQIPGGTVDYANGELPMAAALREAEEETGMEIVETQPLCVMNSFYYGSERPIHLAFVGRASSDIIPQNPEPAKAGDWHWVPLDDLPAEKWFRMSLVAVEFYKELLKDRTIPRFFIDQEFMDIPQN
jgi:8-oxo-dGTP pyrophosphatase MutT (NUDIX family)